MIVEFTKSKGQFNIGNNAISIAENHLRSNEKAYLNRKIRDGEGTGQLSFENEIERKILFAHAQWDQIHDYLSDQGGALAVGMSLPSMEELYQGDPSKLARVFDKHGLTGMAQTARKAKIGENIMPLSFFQLLSYTGQRIMALGDTFDKPTTINLVLGSKLFHMTWPYWSNERKGALRRLAGRLRKIPRLAKHANSTVRTLRENGIIWKPILDDVYDQQLIANDLEYGYIAHEHSDRGTKTLAYRMEAMVKELMDTLGKPEDIPGSQLKAGAVFRLWGKYMAFPMLSLNRLDWFAASPTLGRHNPALEGAIMNDWVANDHHILTREARFGSGRSNRRLEVTARRHFVDKDDNFISQYPMVPIERPIPERMSRAFFRWLRTGKASTKVADLIEVTDEFKNTQAADILDKKVEFDIDIDDFFLTDDVLTLSAGLLYVGNNRIAKNEKEFWDIDHSAIAMNLAIQAWTINIMDAMQKLLDMREIPDGAKKTLFRIHN